MTNTKFRKRALISSVAMLLVALVALGSATFAWFSQNSKATADGIYAKTQQGSNIKVCETQNGTYAESITFAANTLVPSGSYSTPVTPGGAKIAYDEADPKPQEVPEVSLASAVWKTTTASSIDAAVKGNDKQWENATAGKNFSQTDLYVLYDATSGTVNVDINFNKVRTSGVDSFLRVALVPTGSDTTAIFGTDAYVWGAASDDFALDPNAFTAKTGISNTGKTITTDDSLTMFSNKTLTAGTKYHFVVFVWFEGTDPDCIDSLANNDYAIDFEVVKHT